MEVTVVFFLGLATGFAFGAAAATLVWWVGDSIELGDL